jgi:uncharacterized protein YndB with AHSA1/START domain
VPTTTRSTTIQAPLQDIWELASDPHHLPRWWPRVVRVEGVDATGFTQVMQTPKGKTVRADYVILESSAPDLRRWGQQLENTPFERVLSASETELRLREDGDATTVTLSLTQKLKGMSAFGSFTVKGAAKGVLDEALEGLRKLMES